MVSIIENVKREGFKFFTKDTDKIKPEDGIFVCEKSKPTREGESFLVTRVEKDFFDATPYKKMSALKDIGTENLYVFVTYRRYSENK